jgi:membrane protease YdiL (CAAX protease family)
VTAPATAPLPAPPGQVRPKWPAWFGFAALAGSLFVGAFAIAIMEIVVQALGNKVSSHATGVTLAGTVIADLALAVSAVALAAYVARPQAWHFGLRRTPLGRAVKWAVIVLVAYFAFQILYALSVHPDEKQTTLKDLGAGSGGLITVVIGLVVVGMAPVIEEFFFRGFFYTSLRNRFSFVAAAAINGIVFGALHAQTGVQAVPPLVVLGIALCVLYEATGSILPGIALHALNNMLAFGVDKDGSWPVAIVVAATVVLGCIVVPALGRPARAVPG